MDEMSSRERVVTALEHREPDRVPFDCTFSSGAYHRLKEYLDFETREVVKPGGPFLNVRPPIDFMRLLKVDLFYIGLGRGENSPVTSDSLHMSSVTLKPSPLRPHAQ
jgi:uroporphyrinogen decarboxylase